MTENQIHISVVMLLYNRQQFMRQAIESVINQTFQDFEFIILDNGSTGMEVYNIASEYAARDKRIKLHREEHNLGLAAGRRKVLALATGKHLATIEDDDYWALDKLEKQHAFLESNQDVMVYACSSHLIDPKGSVIGKHIIQDGVHSATTDIKELVSPVRFGGSGLLFRRKELLDLGGWKDFFNNADDMDLYFRIQEKYKWATCSDCLIYYRKWGGNTSKIRNFSLYDAVTRISAYFRRVNQPDPIDDPDIANAKIEDVFLKYHFSAPYLSSPKWHQRYTRKAAKYFLVAKQYNHLSTLLAKAKNHSANGLTKLYANLIIWSIAKSRLDFWLHRKSD